MELQLWKNMPKAVFGLEIKDDSTRANLFPL